LKNLGTASGFLAVLLLSLARCASTAPSGATATPAEPITPADLVASIADVASGQNPDVAAAGLVLKRIEFKLAVGRKTEGGGKVEILLLDAEASRSTESAFLQEFTLEIPAEPHRRAAGKPLVPGVREFVEDAMHAARDLARAASDAGLPQRLKTVELTAKITRSRKLGGGITATFPSVLKPSLGVEVGRTLDEENTLRLLFEAP
jgi:hypothetical protein